MNIKATFPILNLTLKHDSDEFSIYPFQYLKAPFGTKKFAYDPDVVREFGSCILGNFNNFDGLNFHGNTKDVNGLSNCKSLFQIAQDLMSMAEGKLFSLWFVKDNSAFVQAMLLFDIDNSHPFFSQSGAFYSNASCSFEKSTFTQDEIRRAIRLDDQFTRLMNHNTPVDESPEWNGESPIAPGSEAFLLYNEDFNRLTRAYYLLRLARTMHSLPPRITSYIALLETLFTTNDNSREERLKHRVVKYLNEASEPLFTTIGDGYKIRSNYIHGNHLGKNNLAERNKLIGVSTCLDELIRKIFIKIIQEDGHVFNQKQEEFSNFLLGLYNHSTEKKEKK